MILFSICIPAYRHGHIVEETINSGLAQCNGSPLEILVVNDFSDDNTRAICLPYLKKGLIKYWENDTNLGMVRNWNRCIELSRGDVINILHSDDRLEPNALKLARKAFEENPDLGILHSKYNSKCLSFEPGQHKYTFYPAGPQSVLNLTGVICSSVFVRKACYLKVGNFSTEFPFSADEEMWARLVLNFPSACSHMPLARWREHTDNYEIKTWIQPNFADQYLAIKHRIFIYAGHNEFEASKKAHSVVSQIFAYSVARRLLRLGNFDSALYYLKKSTQLNYRLFFNFSYWTLFFKSLWSNIIHKFR